SCYYCLYRYVDGVGSVYAHPPMDWSEEGGHIAATINWTENQDDENADNWRDIDGTMQTTITFEGMPTANLTISIDRTDYHSATGSLTIEYDDTSIALNADAVNIDESDGMAVASITVTNSVGVLELSVSSDSEDDTGTIKVDGEVIGTIGPNNHMDNELIVTYTNGDFETLRF
ncbi:MAG: hypothetical protein R3240_11510, partial [Gammaproteobacteria bacterium]|nr:hypothetical protein [Gammaproteobacteria bacterium]